MAKPKKTAKPKAAATKGVLGDHRPTKTLRRGAPNARPGDVLSRRSAGTTAHAVPPARDTKTWGLSDEDAAALSEDIGIRFFSAREVQDELRSEVVAVWVNRSDLAHADERRLNALKPVRVVNLGSTFGSLRVDRILSDAKEAQPDSVARWVAPLLVDGPRAILATIIELVAHATPEDLESNTLSWLGNHVSHHVRRALLLKELEAAEWNMALVSERLRLGYGSPPTLRAIRDLGLTAAYEAAKAAGKIKRGGAPRRPK